MNKLLVIDLTVKALQESGATKKEINSLKEQFGVIDWNPLCVYRKSTKNDYSKGDVSVLKEGKVELEVSSVRFIEKYNAKRFHLSISNFYNNAFTDDVNPLVQELIFNEDWKR